MKDSLGDRMKADYENRTRFLLPRRTYTIVRVDGKNFHRYTREAQCARPFDYMLMEDMDFTAAALCKEITGAQFAYVQSDEISLLLTDFDSTQAEAWFDGSIQKIASLTASIATAKFNLFRWSRIVWNSEKKVDPYSFPNAYFDSRVFTIPDPVEVENYFIWRQQDATRNSISMMAQAHFDHERLQGKSSDEMQEMLWQDAGINWNDQPGGFKRGRCVVRETEHKTVEYTDKRTGETKTAPDVERHVWKVGDAPPIWTKDRTWLKSRIPSLLESA